MLSAYCLLIQLLTYVIAFFLIFILRFPSLWTWNSNLKFQNNLARHYFFSLSLSFSGVFFILNLCTITYFRFLLFCFLTFSRVLFIKKKNSNLYIYIYLSIVVRAISHLPVLLIV